MNKKKAIVIDGNSLLYRQYYATEAQAQWAIEHGYQPMNAVIAMIKACSDLFNLNEYEYGLIAFDHWKKNFRHEQYEGYKQGRAKMPDPLVSQLPIVYEALQMLGYKIQSLPTFEADDLVGSFCHLMEQNDVETIVYTSDHDLLQLVDVNTNVCIIKKGITGVVYTADNFTTLNAGLTPQQIPDFKGLSGDHSDHLPGVPGIGPKTSQQLLLNYGTVETIYEHLSELKPGTAKKLVLGQESAFMCKELATIKIDLFATAVPEEFIFQKQDWEALKNLLERYGIDSARITRSSDSH